MANKVIVGPNQEMICKYVAKEIGNVHSSVAVIRCYLRESELESGHPPWRGKPSELCVVKGGLGGQPGDGPSGAQEIEARGFLFGSCSLKACPGHPVLQR